MALRWSMEKESVAHHEAGHRVMAFVVGAPPKEIFLQWDDEEGWVGGVRDFTVSQTDRELLALIALAGPWAEIKYRARRCWSTARFDQAEQLDGLISYLEEPGPEQEPSVAFLTDVGRKELRIDVGAFSDDVADACKLYPSDNGLLEKFMHQVRCRLEERPVWSAIEALAIAVLQRLGDRREVTFPPAEADRIAQVFLRSRP